MADGIIIALITAGFPTLTTAITTAQDVYITRTVGTGAHFSARLYNQNLNASSTWVDATTEWTSSGAVPMPVNDKYIGVNVYEAGSTLTNHLKVGVEYLWFAMANDS